MSEAPDATVQPDEPVNEFDFTENALAKMGETFPELFGREHADDPAPEPAPAEPEPEAEAEAETPPAEQEVRRNAAGRAIDEQGNFIPEPGGEPQADATLEPEAAPAAPDPALLAAQQAALRAQQDVQALQAQMDALQAGVTQRLTVPPHELAEMVEEDPRRAAHVARNQGDLDTMDEALRAWAAEGPSESYEASAFRSDTDRRIAAWEAQQAAAQAQAQAQNAAQPDRDLAPIAEVLKAHPDLPALQPQMDEVVKDYPLLHGALQPENPPAVQAEALRTLYGLTKARHTDTVTSDAQQAAQAQAAEAAVAARRDAEVVTASQNGTTTEPSDGATLIRTMFREGAVANGFMQNIE